MSAAKIPPALTVGEITARMPRLLRYIASIMAASEAGDTGVTLQCPSDLPLDEGTYTGLIFLVTQLADMTGVRADEFLEWADEIDPPAPTQPTDDNG